MAAGAQWFVIVNPASAGGRAARRWPALAAALTRQGVAFRAVMTDAPGHGVLLARRALAEGYRHLLAAGGDGILHEVVNGVLQEDPVVPESVCVGAAALGSGNDWARGRGLPDSPDGIAACVARGHSSLHDLGRLRFEAPGRPERFFVNVAGAGLDAEVIERLPASGPRRAAYLVGLLRALRAHRRSSFNLSAAERTWHGPLMLALAAIGPRCGGGMRLAPQARADDGLLDVVAIAPVRLPWDLVRLPRLFDGRLPGESLRQALA